MLFQDNLVLTRSDPSGMGGTQLIYRLKNYGLSAVNRPQEEINQIHWEVEVLKFKDEPSQILRFVIRQNGKQNPKILHR
ncbi:MAG: hypothetical protein Ct9H300mP23_06820 [Nitrospinota bacterium]|nr:MAG: hypothetical protein Ct9H300mP23_06820 [Nitrospinota bacterium]